MPLRGISHSRNDGPELDPCLAAERRLKSSMLSKRSIVSAIRQLWIKCGICIVIVLLMAIVIFAFTLHFLLSDSDSRPEPNLQRTTTTRRVQPKPTQKITKTPLSKAKILPDFSPSVHGNRTFPSCAHVKSAGLPSGVYKLQPEEREFDALCDSMTDGGGWTVIQKRINGNTYFYNRTWVEYKNGFGDPHENYWLGLQSMYELQSASSSPHILRIELFGDFCSDPLRCSGMPDGSWWGEWHFTLDNEVSDYTLRISRQIRGNLNNQTDHFKTSHDGKPFTTIDRDNDRRADANCAQLRMFGGWWHFDCGYTALNGVYGDISPKMRYQYWYHQHGNIAYYIHPKKSFIMIR